MTSLQGNPNTLREHPVCEAATRLKGCKNLVVIAVLSSSIGGVKDMLHALEDDNTVIETIIFAV